MIKVISFGKKKGQLTAEIVVNGEQTKHVHQLSGKDFVDNNGRHYEIAVPKPKEKKTA